MASEAVAQERRARIRIVIADDHRLVLSGLRAALADAEGIEVVGEATTGRAAVKTVIARQPDVCLLDLRMPDGDGFWALREIRREAPNTRVVVLSMHDDPAARQPGARRRRVRLHRQVDRARRAGLRHPPHGRRHRLHERRRALLAALDLAGQPAAPDHRARARDPAVRRRGPLELADRQAAVGHRADGEVPPLEHLSQARRLEPHRGEPLRAASRPRALRRHVAGALAAQLNEPVRARRLPHPRG